MEKINQNKLLTPAVKKIAVVLFVIIQTVLWFLIMFAKISVFNVSYFSLCLTFVYVIIFASHDKISAFQILAFAFTLIADYHLILLGGGDKVFAMVAFNVAQLFYALKTLVYKNKEFTLKQVCKYLQAFVAQIAPSPTAVVSCLTLFVLQSPAT